MPDFGVIEEGCCFSFFKLSASGTGVCRLLLSTRSGLEGRELDLPFLIRPFEGSSEDEGEGEGGEDTSGEGLQGSLSSQSRTLSKLLALLSGMPRGGGLLLRHVFCAPISCLKTNENFKQKKITSAESKQNSRKLVEIHILNC